MSVRSSLNWRLFSVPKFRNRLLLFVPASAPAGKPPEKRRPTAGSRVPLTWVGTLS
ncbi:MAG: hypothetical protein ACK5Y8_12015 [Betaproteobacteria bacterium]|nr:hypothetical protein [Rubrivivax sp.]